MKECRDARRVIDSRREPITNMGATLAEWMIGTFSLDRKPEVRGRLSAALGHD
jgi:hypothetical protein